jgi:hypothetical protein
MSPERDVADDVERVLRAWVMEMVNTMYLWTQ